MDDCPIRSIIHVATFPGGRVVHDEDAYRPHGLTVIIGTAWGQGATSGVQPVGGVGCGGSDTSAARRRAGRLSPATVLGQSTRDCIPTSWPDGRTERDAGPGSAPSRARACRAVAGHRRTLEAPGAEIDDTTHARSTMRCARFCATICGVRSMRSHSPPRDAMAPARSAASRSRAASLNSRPRRRGVLAARHALTGNNHQSSSHPQTRSSAAACGHPQCALPCVCVSCRLSTEHAALNRALR